MTALIVRVRVCVVEVVQGIALFLLLHKMLAAAHRHGIIQLHLREHILYIS